MYFQSSVFVSLKKFAVWLKKQQFRSQLGDQTRLKLKTPQLFGPLFGPTRYYVLISHSFEDMVFCKIIWRCAKTTRKIFLTLISYNLMLCEKKKPLKITLPNPTTDCKSAATFFSFVCLNTVHFSLKQKKTVCRAILWAVGGMGREVRGKLYMLALFFPTAFCAEQIGLLWLLGGLTFPGLRGET